VCAFDLTVNPSRFEPGSTPTAIGWQLRLDGSTLSRTQNTPFLKNGVAFFDLIQRLALAGVVGISGLLFWSTTATNIDDKSYF
jgi:hypothetical protein